VNVSSTTMAIYAALTGNLLIAVTKFVAAFWTGSSAMLSEGFHSLVDTSNEVLLLYGQHRAAKPPDREHPLGHGRELYFWSFIVAVLIFALGAGLALYEGVQHIREPIPLEGSYTVNYIVLGLSFLFESASWWVAFRNFRRGTMEGDGIFEAIQESKDPPAFIVLLEDSAALIGLLIAFAGVGAADYFDRPEFDGAASIGIGLLLAATAYLLARESKSLLIGEAATPEIERAIRRIVASDPAVNKIARLWTLHLSPDQIVAVMELDFAPISGQVEDAIERIQSRVRSEVPEVITTFIKPPDATPVRADGLLAEAKQG
jgi:cation diffusion facilitator family transporter